MAAQQVFDKFSLDTPFGVALWPYFDKVYTAATGKSANSFAFIEGVTPLSTQREGIVSFIPSGKEMQSLQMCTDSMCLF